MDEIRKLMDSAKLKSKQDFLAYKNKILPKLQKRQLKKDYSAEASGIFVGEYGYPNVNVGVLSTEEYQHNNDVQHWIKNEWKISQIAEARLDLINSKRSQFIKTPLTNTQELALADSPSGVEISLEKEPSLGSSFSKFALPMGPSAALKSITLTENPSIPTSVEKATGDTDASASEGLKYLYQKGLEKNYLTQIFSAGALGKGRGRRLVPTKWSITATDDILGKQLLEKIRHLPQTGNVAYQGSYMGNYFLILFLDGPFSYELFEFFRDAEGFTRDYESPLGRKEYAKETAGGYYAARISICEKMLSIKRQSQALVLRFITDEYYMPLGVWVVRTAVQKAMESKPIEFGSEQLMIQYAQTLAKKKFNRDLSWLKAKSKLLLARKQSLHAFGI